MKVTETMFIDEFQAIRPENFTYRGLRALFANLEQLEEDIGEEMELDVNALCCSWDEYPTAECAAAAYGLTFDSEEEAFDWLNSETTVIEFDGGIIVETFNLNRSI